jgi:hypothetical protein
MDHQQWLEQHDRMIADMDRMLRRAIRDSVREARNERVKRRELDHKITQLAAAQLITEEKMQANEEQSRTTKEQMEALFRKMDAFLDRFKPGGNWHAN